jgi:hypothetical protein
VANLNEREDAIRLADKVLDRINGDPDDDLALLARQFLRANEIREQRLPTTYALALLAEEAAEVTQQAMKWLRFGPDTPGWVNNKGLTPRQLINEEVGDLIAAMEFAELHGLLDDHAISLAADRKLAKLLNPAILDNLGRPLAPQPPASKMLNDLRIRFGLAGVATEQRSEALAPDTAAATSVADDSGS